MTHLCGINRRFFEFVTAVWAVTFHTTTTTYNYKKVCLLCVFCLFLQAVTTQCATDWYLVGAALSTRINVFYLTFEDFSKQWHYHRNR